MLAAQLPLLKKLQFMCMLLLQHTEEMDGARFAKLCRDGKLLSSAVTASDADLYFAKVGALPCSALHHYH